MAGISGLDDFIKGLDELADKAEKLNDVAVTIVPTDSVTSVTDKLRAEIRRRGAMELDESTLREIAQKKLREAQAHF